MRDDVGFEATAAAEGEPQRAVTHYLRLADAELPHAVDRYPTSRYALLELAPETGRRHQLRRHLKHDAHPVIGDATYGKGRHNRLFAQLFGSHRLLLACVELGLTHPATGRPLGADGAARGRLPARHRGAGVGASTCGSLSARCCRDRSGNADGTP